MTLPIQKYRWNERAQILGQQGRASEAGVRVEWGKQAVNC